MHKIVFDFDGFASKALGEIGEILVDNSKQSMDKVSHGRVYIVGGRVHIASKAGDTANNMTGALKKTIRFEIQGKVLEFGAGNSQVDYAKYLEMGTKKMEKRPNYTKTLLQNQNQIDAKVKKLFEDSIRFA